MKIVLKSDVSRRYAGSRVLGFAVRLEIVDYKISHKEKE